MHEETLRKWHIYIYIYIYKGLLGFYIDLPYISLATVVEETLVSSCKIESIQQPMETIMYMRGVYDAFVSTNILNVYFMCLYYYFHFDNVSSFSIRSSILKTSAQS